MWVKINRGSSSFLLTNRRKEGVWEFNKGGLSYETEEGYVKIDVKIKKKTYQFCEKISTSNSSD